MLDALEKKLKYVSLGKSKIGVKDNIIYRRE